MRECHTTDSVLRHRARRRVGTAAAVAFVAATAVGLAGGCSTSGRDLPAPTTTKVPTPQVITTTATAR